jgi:hypothetical protein
MFYQNIGFFCVEAHRNGWHAASSYRNAILTSELAFPFLRARWAFLQFIYVSAKKALACNK